MRLLAPACVLAATLLAADHARALDKQASAHKGDVNADHAHDTELNVSGAATLGLALVNPSYGARPDNSGRALMRYALHLDIDLIGRHLSIPLDVNVFSDRTRKGGLVLLPTELDLIGGLTTTQKLTIGTALEVGARVEHDAPVDRGGFTQTYADVRTRWLYSLGDIWPSLERDLVGGGVNGWLGLGWFAINPSYAARPDNTGIALFRYMAHSELSVYKRRLGIGFDATMFTDRRSDLVVRPSEIDATYELIGRIDPFEVHLAYERDMPIDRRGLIQDFIYVLVVYDFDFRHDVRLPLEDRGSILSP